MNVRHLLILLTIPLISGCVSLGWKSPEPVVIKKESVERTRLNLADPTPLKSRSPKWVVITPENADKVWKDLKEQKVDLVLFALTDEGYEELAVTMAELRNFINTQRTIILKYKEYYEPVKTDNVKDKK